MTSSTTGMNGDTRPSDQDPPVPSLADSLSDLPTECASFVMNLSKYETLPATIEYPRNKMAAVLVLLHADSDGELQVLLTTRSYKLRSHPGDVALPGGRIEGDETIEQTALREAFEEVGLPLEAKLVHLVTLPAFTSRTLLVVIPCVYLLTDLSLLANLEPNPDEVDDIFSVPLRTFLNLSTNKQQGASTRSHNAIRYSYEDYLWLEERFYRLHSFDSPSIPRPITGLTADILITVALIAFYGLSAQEELDEPGLPTSDRLGFERRAKGQMSWQEIVKVALSMPPGQRGLKDQRSSAT